MPWGYLTSKRCAYGRTRWTVQQITQSLHRRHRLSLNFACRRRLKLISQRCLLSLYIVGRIVHCILSVRLWHPDWEHDEFVARAALKSQRSYSRQNFVKSNQGLQLKTTHSLSPPIKIKLNCCLVTYRAIVAESLNCIKVSNNI